MVDVAEAEMENSLDPDYVAKMAAAKDNLGHCKCFMSNTAQNQETRKNFVYRLSGRVQHLQLGRLL